MKAKTLTHSFWIWVAECYLRIGIAIVMLTPFLGSYVLKRWYEEKLDGTE